ncbi:coiled-coil domain-containing protein 86 [Dendrobates tinctorius]|uniref:coiled-coil domain-containing protein 86 n=1 Tax=Dendrobates tinctorius TaxID=92724 RepID=UPI003CCA3A5F
MVTAFQKRPLTSSQRVHQDPARGGWELRVGGNRQCQRQPTGNDYLRGVMERGEKPGTAGAPVLRGAQGAAHTLEEPTEAVLQGEEEAGRMVQEGHDKREAMTSVQVDGFQEEKKGGRGTEQPGLKRKRGAPATAHKTPQGRPKSGRVWKENKKRFSNMVRDRPLCTSWEVKMKQRQEKKLLKSLAQQLKDEKQREKEEKKRRREENLRRRLENERKAEVVQVIRNSAKLKRARKKQLRSIEKRDTLMMSKAGKKLPQKKSASSKGTEKKEAISR